MNGKVGGILDRLFFHAARPVEIQVEQPQKEDYEEYTELENLDGFRFEADIYMSKLDIQCHSK